MKAHLIDTHKVKIICKGQSQISGSCFSKDGCFGDISVSQTHLVFQGYLVKKCKSNKGLDSRTIGPSKNDLSYATSSFEIGKSHYLRNDEKFLDNCSAS